MLGRPQCAHCAPTLHAQSTALLATRSRTYVGVQVNKSARDTASLKVNCLAANWSVRVRRFDVRHAAMLHMNVAEHKLLHDSCSGLGNKRYIVKLSILTHGMVADRIASHRGLTGSTGSLS